MILVRRLHRWVIIRDSDITVIMVQFTHSIISLNAKKRTNLCTTDAILLIKILVYWIQIWEQ